MLQQHINGDKKCIKLSAAHEQTCKLHHANSKSKIE